MPSAPTAPPSAPTHAAAALAGRAGTDGLTREVLQTLSAVWPGAGLESDQFSAPIPATNPFMLLSAHKVHAGTVAETDSGEMFRFTCKCGLSWDSPAEGDDELAEPAAHIKGVMEEAGGMAQIILDDATRQSYPLTSELRELLEPMAAEAQHAA